MQSEHSGLYKLRSVYWLLTYAHDYENWGKSVQRFLFIQIALFVSTCRAHPFPTAIKSMVQSVEGVASELRAALWCPGLLC